MTVVQRRGHGGYLRRRHLEQRRAAVGLGLIGLALLASLEGALAEWVYRSAVALLGESSGTPSAVEPRPRLPVAPKYLPGVDPLPDLPSLSQGMDALEPVSRSGVIGESEYFLGPCSLEAGLKAVGPVRGKSL